MTEQPPPDCSGICWYMYCVILQWPPCVPERAAPETRWLRIAGSADRDRPLACCPDCREVAFDGDVVESERKVQAHVLGSGVVCGRKPLTPYDGFELRPHDGGVAGVLADDAGHIGRRQPVAIGLDHRTAAASSLVALAAQLATRLPGRSRSCHHLGEHLLGGELVPVGAARVLADGGDKLAELVVAGDPELNPAGAAADVPG